MKLMFIGAAHEVTGSCHYLEACGKHILIDYGMEQGENIYENAELPISPSMVDFCLLTHAHIDHSGMLPRLYALGFQGTVITTKATYDLAQIMLRDSAHIQMSEADWRNRKAKRAGKPLYEPVYTMEDADGVLHHFQAVNYNEVISLADGICVRFTDVGHLLGSACIEVWIQEDGIKKKLLFSGDIGNINQPLIKDPHTVDSADYVIMESTYGDRLHSAPPDYVTELAQILQETFDRGGNVIIPSFAVGRTQEMLYFLRKIKSEHLLNGHEDFPVYVDSPLAVNATNIFQKNTLDCFDKDAMELVAKGINPLQFAGLRLSITSEESKAINFDERPKVILSASGMCEAGRIRHHLKHNLWRKESSILFVGYQAYGTLGRALLEGAGTVKLFGETIEVHARILKMAGLSGHADKDGLLHWINALTEKPDRIFVVHGEDTVCDSFAECLKQEYHMDAVAPFSGTVYDLATNTCIEDARPLRVAPKKAAERKATTVYLRLVAAGQRLMNVIQSNEGGANKDLAKFADQIQALCDKWES